MQTHPSCLAEHFHPRGRAGFRAVHVNPDGLAGRVRPGSTQAIWRCKRSDNASPNFLTSWPATTLLVGEYTYWLVRDNPIFTVTDDLIWLWQISEGNSLVRKLQIMKLRGQPPVPGLHTIRINRGGLQAFSGTLGLTNRKARHRVDPALSTGLTFRLGGREDPARPSRIAR